MAPKARKSRNIRCTHANFNVFYSFNVSSSVSRRIGTSFDYFCGPLVAAVRTLERNVCQRLLPIFLSSFSFSLSLGRAWSIILPSRCPGPVEIADQYHFQINSIQNSGTFPNASASQGKCSSLSTKTDMERYENQSNMTNVHQTWNGTSHNTPNQTNWNHHLIDGIRSERTWATSSEWLENMMIHRVQHDQLNLRNWTDFENLPLCRLVCLSNISMASSTCEEVKTLQYEQNCPAKFSQLWTHPSELFEVALDVIDRRWSRQSADENLLRSGHHLSTHKIFPII